MKEVTGNLWTYKPADCVYDNDIDNNIVRVITTNGYVKNNGKAVMGRGCALEARNRFRDLDLILGEQITENGNNVRRLVTQHHNSNFPQQAITLVSFPVKHNWWEPADLALIERSAIQIANLAWRNGHWQHIIIPRPGCGNGQLNWSDVKPILEPILDDRFLIITF